LISASGFGGSDSSEFVEVFGMAAACLSAALVGDASASEVSVTLVV